MTESNNGLFSPHGNGVSARFDICCKKAMKLVARTSAFGLLFEEVGMINGSMPVTLPPTPGS